MSARDPFQGLARFALDWRAMQGLAILAVSLVSFAAALAVYEALNAWGGVKELASPFSDKGAAADDAAPKAKGAASRAAERASAAVNRLAPLSKSERSSLREKLRLAGMSIEPETWRCVSLLVVAGCTALAAIAAFAVRLAPVWAVFATGLSFALSVCGLRLYLASRRRARRLAVDRSLPDAMELLGVALAAGSPVEQSFREVAESLDGPLSEEFRLVDREVNLLGHSRSEALEHLSARCESQEVTAFTAQLSQAIDQGASVAEGLANQAALARSRAQASALERIRKMPTKLDVILSLCFLPPTTLLVLVPTVVDLMSFFSQGMA